MNKHIQKWCWNQNVEINEQKGCVQPMLYPEHLFCLFLGDFAMMWLAQKSFLIFNFVLQILYSRMVSRIELMMSAWRPYCKYIIIIDLMKQLTETQITTKRYWTTSRRCVSAHELFRFIVKCSKQSLSLFCCCWSLFRTAHPKFLWLSLIISAHSALFWWCRLLCTDSSLHSI